MSRNASIQADHALAFQRKSAWTAGNIPKQTGSCQPQARPSPACFVRRADAKLCCQSRAAFVAFCPVVVIDTARPEFVFSTPAHRAIEGSREPRQRGQERPRGGVVTQRTANPRTPVQFRAWPPISPGNSGIRHGRALTASSACAVRETSPGSARTHPAVRSAGGARCSARPRSRSRSRSPAPGWRRPSPAPPSCRDRNRRA